MLGLRRLAGAAPAAALIALIVVPALAGSTPAAPDPVAAPHAARVGAARLPTTPLSATEEDAARVERRLDADASGDRRLIAQRSRATVEAAAAIVPGSVNRTSLKLTAEYDVALTLNYGTRAFRVDSTMSVRNDSGGPIDRLELNTIAARLGGMRLRSALVAGTPVPATVDDQTIVVQLGGVLAAGDSVTVRIVYAAALRSSLTGSNWLFTRTNGIVDAHRWIPWVSRRVGFDRPNHGDPFVTPVSPRVRVTMTTDRPLVVASTGERIAGSGLRQTFEGRNVRDFVFSAAADYRTISTKVGTTVVRVYYRPGFPASAVLSAARSALAKMAPLVGAYPYPTYDLAQSAGGYGMEAPGLTWIPTGVGSANLKYLVAHETAHQWFYGLVGNDQAAEPFTDEAAADFLARNILGLRRASRCSTARLDLSIYRYSSTCYYEVIYIQGGNFLDDLRRRMGSTAFWRGIRAYVATNRYGLVATKTLLSTLDTHTSLNLVPRFEPRFPRLY